MAKATKEDKVTIKFVELTDIEKRIQYVTKKAASIQQDIHSLAVSVLKYWHDQKIDSAEAARLMNGVQEASPYHRKAFSKWVGQMTDLIWNEEEKKWVGAKDGKIMGKAFQAARDTPFWKLSPPDQAKPYDMAQAINAILKQVKRHSDKPVEGDNINVAAVKYLTEALKLVEVK